MARDHVDWLHEQTSRRTALADPALSPLRGEHFDGMAPAIVLTAGFDPLCEEGFEYARKLDAAGVPVTLLHYPGQFHGFLSFDGVLAHAREALDRLGGALAHALEKGRVEPVVVAATGDRQGGLLLWLRPAQRWKEAVVVCEMAMLGLGWMARRWWRAGSQQRH